jgi:hypothetical protein
MKASLLLLPVAALFTAAPLEAAQAPDTTSTSTPRLTVQAVRLTSPVSIDGKLDEPIWGHEFAVTTFTQRDPNEGATPSQRSEVRIAYDDAALYIGARMHDEQPDSILARLTRRDVSIPADRFCVYLDPLCDRRSGYYFMMSAAGTLFDGTLYNDGWEDNSWDGVWEGKARVDEQGWTAEMKIPYSQLRFAKNGANGARMKWGINFARFIQRHNENAYMVIQPKSASGFVSRFPDLVGLEDIKTGHTFEVTPYATGKASYLSDGVHEYDPNGGLDFRTRVAGKLIWNGTVNPDFGQVEVDPAVVNLSDVETFYPEKRPFFVDGAANFRFGQEGASDYWGFNWPEPTFFYSRRIGGNGETILGASKLTGKINSTTNLGGMVAATNEDDEPLTLWGDMSMLKEFSSRRAGLGFKVNGAGRDFESTGLQNSYNQNSLFTGVDGWWFLDSKQKWVVSGWSGVSHITGTQERMTAVQSSALHYMQRPDDEDGVQIDSTATSLTGHGTRLWVNKQSGDIFFNAAAGYMNQRFDVNDIGFMSRADVVNAHVGTGKKWTKTTASRKYQDVIVALFSAWDTDLNRQQSGVWSQGMTEFQNNHTWQYWLAYNPGGKSNRRTRGGPLMKVNPGYQVGTYYDTDGKARWFYFIEVGTYQQPVEESYNYYVMPGVEWKPASNVSLRVGPNYNQTRENAQYVTTVADPSATNTYGHRYVFAALDQRTISADIRLNWAFNPTMSLQFYGQPLISMGEYTNYKSLARPGSYEFDPYPIANGSDDFNFKSLRGNAVFRWEYRPGSAFFLVWSHERVNDQLPGTSFNFKDGFDTLWNEPADNIFLAKMTYYFNM